MMQTVILAGGLGTRLRPLTLNVPKPMVLVNGKPFLEYEIALLKRYGAKHFVICAGYMHEVISDYFGDGKEFGVEISYSLESKDNLLGPAGALKKAEPLLEENFIVTYADAYLVMDYASAWKFFIDSGKLGMMVVYENHDRFGKSDLEVKGGYVEKYDKKKKTSDDMIWINFGVSFLKKQALNFIPSGRACGEEEFYNKLIDARELLAFEAKQRFYEIGTVPALEEFSKYISKNQSGM